MEHTAVAVHSLPLNPLHRHAPQAAYGTKGRRLEGGGGGRGDQAEDEGEGDEENRGEESNEWTSAEIDSGTSGSSSTRDIESLAEGADGKSEVEEDGGGWTQVSRCLRQRDR